MNKKNFICAVVILLVSFAPINASRKKAKTAKTKVPKTEQRVDEIDNFDFLYTGEEYDGYDYTVLDNLMNEAYSHIGTRYRSGAKGPSAFDCSGFTSYVFGRMGIQIGGSSRDQYARNQPIKNSEMEAGDLVFFTSPNSGRGVGHVGIVVDVNHENGTFTFIHASSSSGVKVSSSTDGYYSRRYIGVRRVM